MLEVILTCSTPEGSQEIVVDRERISFGRGTDATYRFPDNSLSRLHATVYREGDRVWIVDENSANGTFINGTPAAPAGTPLRNGDSIRIGNETTMNVLVREPALAPPPIAAAAAATASNGVDVDVESGGSGSSHISIIAISLVGIAFLVICVSGLFVA